MNKVATMCGVAALGRGLVAVRAKAEPKTPASIEDLAVAFEAFKDAHTQQLNEIKAGKTDVLTTDKLETINTALSELQAAVDEQARITAAAKLGN